MRCAWLVVLIPLAACRLGFDPVDGADDDMPLLGGVAAEHPIVAGQDSDFFKVCTPGVPCQVDCTAAATCYVDCTGASHCDVTCGHGDCAATGCLSSLCTLDCAIGEIYDFGDNQTCSL